MALRADERVHAEQRLYAVQVARLRHAVVKTAAVGARGLPLGPRKQDQVVDVRAGNLSTSLSRLKMAKQMVLPVQKPSVPKTANFLLTDALN